MSAKDWKVGDVLVCTTDRFLTVCPKGFESTITARFLVDGLHVGWYSTDAIGSPSSMEFEKYDAWFYLKSDAPTNSEVAQLQARVAELEGALAARQVRYDLISEFARRENVSYNSLCALVREATGQ